MGTHFSPRDIPSHIMNFLFGLCMLLLISVPVLEATIPITIGAGAGALALTAPQVSGLIALKLLAVAKGVLIGRLISRGRRSVDEIEIDTDIVSEIASNELEQCTQLLFCSAAADSQISLDKNVDDLRRIVTRVPGKYKKAHQVGKLSGSEKCVASYDCSISLENLVTVINSI